MSKRKPNMNKTYDQNHQFYTQAKNIATVEHRAKIAEEKLMGEKTGGESPLLSLAKSTTVQTQQTKKSFFLTS